MRRYTVENSKIGWVVRDNHRQIILDNYKDEETARKVANLFENLNNLVTEHSKSVEEMEDDLKWNAKIVNGWEIVKQQKTLTLMSVLILKSWCKNEC